MTRSINDGRISYPDTSSPSQLRELSTSDELIIEFFLPADQVAVDEDSRNGMGARDFLEIVERLLLIILIPFIEVISGLSQIHVCQCLLHRFAVLTFTIGEDRHSVLIDCFLDSFLHGCHFKLMYLGFTVDKEKRDCPYTSTL
jgi:hypothetical protein